MELAQNLTPDAQAEIHAALNQAVAETVVTTMLAQNFHWNITGMGFGPLHTMFQTIYEDHFVAQDDIAERIKAVDGHAVGKLSDMIAASKVEEHDGHATDKEMIAALVKAQKTVSATLVGAATIAAAHGDVVTEDLCIGRAQTHDKFAWLLAAHLR